MAAILVAVEFAWPRPAPAPPPPRGPQPVAFLRPLVGPPVARPAPAAPAALAEGKMALELTTVADDEAVIFDGARGAP